MDTLQYCLQYLLHIDTYLFAFVANYGALTYALLFAIIFCETGLVVTPFLPGDSLLFAAGGIAAQPNQPLSFQWLLLLLMAASMLGNKLNYLIGRAVGPRIFMANQTRFFSKNHLMEAHAFYEKHGGKTIILARFIPIIRTFAPFVAGIGYMRLRDFTFYNIVSAVLWIGTLVSAGYFFGALPGVKAHFSLVVYGIVALSLLPPLFAFLYKKYGKTLST